MDNLLKQGISALKSGESDKARAIFLYIVKQEPDNENAWGWLFNAADNDAERVYCLKQILRINPRHKKAEKLYKALLDKQPILSFAIQEQFGKNNKLSSNRVTSTACMENGNPVQIKRFLSPVAMGIWLLIALACGLVTTFFAVPNKASVEILSVVEASEVNSVRMVKDRGYEVTSVVCEVVSPEHDIVQGHDFGRIVFHAFRITKYPSVVDAVVVFASNHTARYGGGTVQAVNPLSKTLFPNFDGSHLIQPVTMDVIGAGDALECAMQAEPYP